MAILDLEKSETPTTFSCEIAIVGAGAVGIAMAAELSRKGHNVLLLEAGGVSLETRSQDIYNNARSSGFDLDGLHAGRFRLLGGTTNFWGGEHARFDPIVFEKRPWLNSDGWLIDRETLDSYYDRALSLIGMDGDEASDAAVWKRAKTELPELSHGLELFFTRHVKILNFAKLFESDLGAAKITTVVHANVIGLEPDPAGGRISRIHMRTFGGRKATVSAERIVLACGTIEISRLLMLPFIDGRETPWHRNPWLGRGYIDHIDTTAAQVKPRNSKTFHDLFENIFFDGFKYNPKIKLLESVQRERRLVGVAGAFLFRTTYQENAQNLRLFVRSILDGRLPPNLRQLPSHVVALWKVAVPLVYRYLRDHRTFHPSNSAILFRVTAEQEPLRESRITLGQERDALDMPLVDVHWKIAGSELETIAYFTEQVRDALREADIADLEIEPSLIARDPRYLESAADTYHQMGGARMGRDPEHGVVDSDLRMYGIDNLYVAGGAVMPSSGFPNVTLTSIALGIRLCDHLAAARTTSHVIHSDHLLEAS